MFERLLSTKEGQESTAASWVLSKPSKCIHDSIAYNCGVIHLFYEHSIDTLECKAKGAFLLSYNESAAYVHWQIVDDELSNRSVRFALVMLYAWNEKAFKARREILEEVLIY